MPDRSIYKRPKCPTWSLTWTPGPWPLLAPRLEQTQLVPYLDPWPLGPAGPKTPGTSESPVSEWDLLSLAPGPWGLASTGPWPLLAPGPWPLLAPDLVIHHWSLTWTPGPWPLLAPRPEHSQVVPYLDPWTLDPGPCWPKGTIK